MKAVEDLERDAGPRFPIAEGRCRVVANDPVNAEYRLMEVEADGAALGAEAGQFFHLACPHTGEDRPFLRRPMSIYRVDRDGGRLAFLYKVQGAGTRGLASLEPGSHLNALGPLGQGFQLPEGTRHVLLLARGVGLATLAPLAGLASGRGAAVTAILSARTEDLVMSELYLSDQGARTIRVTDEAETSSVAAVEALVRELHERDPFDFLATCGSNRLLLLLQKLGAEWGVPGQIAVEQHMGCAIGMCFCCVRAFAKPGGGTTYRRVCYEGPVFDLQEVLP